MSTAQVGWNRLTWNSGAWNTSPDALANVTGQQLLTEVDFGGYWNADEWSSGAWNIGHGAVLTGTGNVFSISTLTELNANTGNVVIAADTDIIITGEELISTVNTITVLNEAIVNITGEELNISQGPISIAGGGSITIQTGAEIALDITLGNTTTGTANFIQIVGEELSISVNNVANFITDQILSITGEELTSSVNTIVVSGSSPVTITGNGVVISLSNANVTTQQILSISGNQANVSVSTLKFWDPIRPTITETWTNIH
jgi:hypothetical protein